MSVGTILSFDIVYWRQSVTSESSLLGVMTYYRMCSRCVEDDSIGPQLRSLPFFLPLPSNVEEPPHTYLFVAMEPSGN